MVEKVTVEVCSGYSLDDGKKQYLPGERLGMTPEDAADLKGRGVVVVLGTDARLTQSAGTVDEGIRMLQSAETVEQIDAMVAGETRKGVLTAAARFGKELAGEEG